MTARWMVLKQRAGGRTVYRAYRLRDPGKPDAEDNRVYYGEGSPNRRMVHALAEVLNEREENHAS